MTSKDELAGWPPNGQAPIENNLSSGLQHLNEMLCEVKDTLASPRIDAQDKIELNAWADKLDVTVVRLRAAINAVGPVVKDVTAWLKK